MDFEETRRLDLVGYDERTESWYLQPRDGRPLQLTRQSLTRLVQLYNSIHKGSPLVLLEQREVRRLEETRLRHSETLRDLYLFLDRKERQRPFRLIGRFFRATMRLLATLFNLPGFNLPGFNLSRFKRPGLSLRGADTKRAFDDPAARQSESSPSPDPRSCRP